MPRYSKAASKPRAGGWIDDDYERFYYDDDEPFRPHLDVDGHEAVDTGLIWETGEPIMRLPNPIGFGRDDEW